MHLCKLCKVNESTKTGSHIISSFLMKRIDNFDGSNNREKELGYYITDSKVKPYFGRGVSKEKLEEDFGEITDVDIKNSRSPEIVDFILCPSCEDRLGEIESNYAKSLGLIQKDSYFSIVDKYISFIFWMSIIWRISISGIHGIKLSAKKEGILRCLLNQHLVLKHSNINDLIHFVKSHHISYKLIRCLDYEAEMGSFVFCRKSKHEPLVFALGEFILFYYSRKKRRTDNDFSYFGLEKHLTNCFSNDIQNNEFVYVINPADFNAYVIQFIGKVSKLKKTSVYKRLDYIHSKRLKGIGDKMPLHMKDNILNEMIENNPIARRYDDDSIYKALYIEVKRNIHLYPFLKLK